VRELVNITPAVRDAVALSGVRGGQVTVLTQHITTGITVNEGCRTWRVTSLRCSRAGAGDADYRHARYFHQDGRLALNRSAISRVRSWACTPMWPSPMESAPRRPAVHLLRELDGPLSRSSSSR